MRAVRLCRQASRWADERSTGKKLSSILELLKPEPARALPLAGALAGEGGGVATPSGKPGASAAKHGAGKKPLTPKSSKRAAERRGKAAGAASGAGGGGGGSGQSSSSSAAGGAAGAAGGGGRSPIRARAGAKEAQGGGAGSNRAPRMR